MWPGETYPSFVTQQSEATKIPTEKLPVIAAAAVAACDELDGAKDGLISEPKNCKFDPATIQCKSGDAQGLPDRGSGRFGQEGLRRAEGSDHRGAVLARLRARE